MRQRDIAQPFSGDGPALVESFGAMQAQEYAYAPWCIGLHLAGATTVARPDDAFARGRILRTDALRPTWHFVSPADIEWLLRLTAPRVAAATAPPIPTSRTGARDPDPGTDVIARARLRRRAMLRAQVTAVRPIRKGEERGILQQLERYGRFVGSDATIAIQPST